VSKIERFKSGDRLRSKLPDNKRLWAVTTGHPGLRPGYYLLYVSTGNSFDFLSIESWASLKRRFILADEPEAAPQGD
jgi:hypothetical protein